MRVPVGRSGPAVLLVLMACAIVAIMATGAGPLFPPAELDGGWIRAVRAGGAVAAAGGLIALLAQRKRHRWDPVRGPDPTASALRTAATIMVVLALLALLAPAARIENGSGGEALVGSGGTRINPEASPEIPPPPPSTAATTTRGFTLEEAREDSLLETVPPAESGGAGSGASGIDWSLARQVGAVLLLILILALAGAGVLLLAGRLPGRRRAEPPPDPGEAAVEAEAGLQASLREVTRESRDPRGQITAAYHRLLEALVTLGATREPQEAPHEHLQRALGSLGVQPDSLHRLTDLYVEAQFSTRPITERHRATAAEALEVSLAALREARNSSPPLQAEPVPEAGRA